MVELRKYEDKSHKEINDEDVVLHVESKYFLELVIYKSALVEPALIVSPISGQIN